MSEPMYTVESPTHATTGLVLDSPHSGNVYPADFDHALDRGILRRSEDAFVEDLFRPAVAMGGVLLHAHFPRCYIDPNRGLADVDVDLIEGLWPHPVSASGKLARGAGLIWRQVKAYGDIYSRKLSVEQVQRRIDHCWQPYHQTLQGLLEAAWERHGRFIHVNCHSMASHGDHTTEDGPVARPDFILGDRDGTSCDPAITGAVATQLRGLGYQVAINDPYKGVELVRKFSDPARQRHSLQVEINRALYMNEETIERLPGYGRLREHLSLVSEGLSALVAQLPDGRQ